MVNILKLVFPGLCRSSWLFPSRICIMYQSPANRLESDLTIVSPCVATRWSLSALSSTITAMGFEVNYGKVKGIA